MMRSIKSILSTDRERYKVPRKVQDVIPIRRIWLDGIFLVGNKFVKSWKFTDINYLVASREDKERMFLTYSELLNSLDSGATTKITVNNHHLKRSDFEDSILMPLKADGLDEYREEYNKMLLDKSVDANGILQEKYVTVTVAKKNIEEARAYFARVGADLVQHFAALGSRCTELTALERLRILHDFYRSGEENAFTFDLKDNMRKGHCFRDYICPDSIEKHADYLKLGERYARVLYLKDYASYIKDSMVAELTDLNRNMMLSIDVIPIPTDEAVREVENRLLGVETNIANWQRRQNSNNNFSAVVPYDMELQRKESKEFLDDLTTRDQRMMFAVITMVITADTKEQLDADTETILSTARKHMCQMAVLKYQQLDGLNTVLPIGSRKINAFRTLTTESLAVFIPFKVQEIRDPGGIYFGESAISHNLIFYIIDTINEAINQHKKIRFRKIEYNVKKERVLHHGGEKYTFSPYSLVWDGDNYYVVGYSDKYENIGSHRVDRIAEQPEILDEPVVPPKAGFSVEKYVKTTFRMYNAPRKEVELLCDNGVMDAIIDQFGPDVHTYAGDLQNFRVIEEVAVGKVFFNWIFGFEGKVRIKAPADVKEQYRQMVENAAKVL